MTADVDVDAALARRRDAIQAALEQRQATAPSMPTYTTAHRALAEANHLPGVTLLAAAEACTRDTVPYEQWIPAALAVEYVAAFTRTHQRATASETSGRDTSQAEDDCRLSDRILAGDLLYTKGVELLLTEDIPEIHMDQVLRPLVRAGRQVCERAVRRRELARQQSVQPAEYFRFVDQYAGPLWAASAKLGGLLGSGTDADITHLESFGRELGRANQLVADTECSTQSRANDATSRSTRSLSDTRRDDTNPSDWQTAVSVNYDGFNMEAIASHVTVQDINTTELRRHAEGRLEDAMAHVTSLPESTGRAILVEMGNRIRSTVR